MKITLDNYPNWALDYIENNLTQQEMSCFERFMAEHPDVAAEVASLQEYMPRAPLQVIHYPQKSGLMRAAPTGRKRPWVMASASVAATAVLGIMLLNTFHHPAPSEGGQSTAIQKELTPGSIGDLGEERSLLTQTGTTESEPETPSTPSIRPNRHSATSAGSPLGNRTLQESSAQNNSSHQGNAAGDLFSEEGRRTGPTYTLLTETLHEGATKPKEGVIMATAVQSGRGAENEIFTRKIEPASSTQTIAPAGVRTGHKEDLQGSYNDERAVPQRNPIFEELPSTINEQTQYLASQNNSGTEVAQGGGRLKESIGVLLEPLNQISPIKRYENESGQGVQIMSIIRIGTRN